jgi:hypothetical protein
MKTKVGSTAPVDILKVNITDSYGIAEMYLPIPP